MLQFITHHTDRYDEIAGTRAVLEGGCRWVQLRMKEADEATFLSIAQEAVELCRSYHARLILDDRVEMVKRVGADGVHLGRKDMPADEARTLLGPDLIIGGTANTIDDVRRLHTDMMTFFTWAMADMQKAETHSKAVNECLDYIHYHLHEKITRYFEQNL